MLNRGSVFCFVICVLVLLGARQTSAQLLRAPLPLPENSKGKSGNAARTKALSPKKLPFWDDFSFPSGIFPQDTLWENSQKVWITRAVGVNTPSIYAATFDGLNERGLPYSAEILNNGYRDTLTSRAIRLDEVTTAINRARTYLSFYYQWQGNGDAPEDTDYLQLDFKRDDGVWVEQFRIYPKAHFDRTVFYDTIVAIGPNHFFHDNFQFRFVSYGRNSGPYDTWNLDYVYLNEDRNTTPISHPDRALASEISSLLKEYRSIPLKHFKEEGEFDSVRVDIMNFKDTVDAARVNAASFSILGTFKNIFADSSYTVLKDVVLAATGDGELRLPFVERKRFAMAAYPDTTNQAQFDPDAAGVTIKITAVLDSEDESDKSKQKNDHIDRTINDTISSFHHLRDFYAYDDGFPEHAVYLTQPNNIAVVEYNMLVDQSQLLTAIDIYLPEYGISSTQTMDFVVYFPDTSNNQPQEQPELTIQDPQLIKDTVFNQGFYRANIGELLVPKKFYIGWIAPSIGKPKIGVDQSTDAGDKIFTRINGVWLRNDDNHHSSIMIRPVFGESTGPVTGIGEYTKSIVLYPNPNKGEFFVSGKYDQLNIINITGQPIAFQKEQQGDKTKVSFQSSPGLYLLRVKNGSRVTTEKFIVVP